MIVGNSNKKALTSPIPDQFTKALTLVAAGKATHNTFWGCTLLMGLNLDDLARVEK